MVKGVSVCMGGCIGLGGISRYWDCRGGVVVERRAEPHSGRIQGDHWSSLYAHTNYSQG